eukprot:SAG31_NODE_681_length_12844_cov_31.703021_1_plen_245_part_00
MCTHKVCWKGQRLYGYYVVPAKRWRTPARRWSAAKDYFEVLNLVLRGSSIRRLNFSPLVDTVRPSRYRDTRTTIILNFSMRWQRPSHITYTAVYFLPGPLRPGSTPAPPRAARRPGGPRTKSKPLVTRTILLLLLLLPLGVVAVHLGPTDGAAAAPAAAVAVAPRRLLRRAPAAAAAQLDAAARCAVCALRRRLRAELAGSVGGKCLTAAWRLRRLSAAGKKLLFRFCAHYQRNTGLLSRDATH